MRPALMDMSRFDPPKADNMLLCFLVGVLSLVSSFALFMYWLLQPTVLADAGPGAFEKEMSVAAILLSRSNIVEIEQSEVEAALLENESQGLQRVAAASHKPQADSTPKPVKHPREHQNPNERRECSRLIPVHSLKMHGRLHQ